MVERYKNHGKPQVIRLREARPFSRNRTSCLKPFSLSPYVLTSCINLDHFLELIFKSLNLYCYALDRK